MARPLIVDTAHLENAGITLESLAFPTFPPPIAAAGSDTASAAINATMPEIEAPVLEGLPAVRTALMSTAANIATAATIYAQADQTLGENLSQLRFDGSGTATERGTATAHSRDALRSAMAPSAELPDTDAAILGRATQLSTQLGQLNGTMGTVNSVTQGVFQSVQGMTTKGAPDKETPDAEELDEAGAADGRHASPEPAPVEPVTTVSAPPRPAVS